MNARQLVSLLSIAALTSPLGCSSDGGDTTSVTPNAANGSVVIVVSVESSPLAGVRVELSGSAAFRSGTTGQDGRIRFTDLPAAGYTVTVSNAPVEVAFENSSQSITVRAGEEATIAFEGALLRTASVSGLLLAWNRPVGDATVELRGPDTLSATTGASGSFSFSGLRSGSYVVIAVSYSAAEYDFPGSLGVSLGPGEAMAVTLEGRIVGPWTTVAVSTWTSCGVIRRDVYCWGSGRFGALGDGRTGNPLQQYTPKWIDGLVADDIAGSNSTFCALSVEGGQWCWGWGAYGSLGNGGYDDALTPSQIVGPLQFGSVSVGFNHACGLDPIGALYCWGRGNLGQLGGSGTDEVAVPTATGFETAFAEVVSGGSHSCALTAEGAAYCWGRGHSGETGTGSGAEEVLVPTLVRGGLVFRQISAGQHHTCGVTTDGEGYCWGLGGMLGTDTEDRFEPVRIPGAHVWAEIQAGAAHTCGIVADGAAFCWGLNGTEGRLGIDDVATNSESLTPVPVHGGLEFQFLSVWGHTCGIEASGRLYCWGSNGFGQMGHGASDDVAPTPVLVGS